jgi:diguanylate cyclase (GGDEF)-like protein
MKNKKKIILLIIGIAIIVFIGLYVILNYTEPNILNSQDKKWIADNGGKVIDIDVINDIPVYSNNGSGVIFDFLDYMKEETNLDFNKIPYLKSGTNFNSKYRFEIVDGSNKLTNEQLLIFTDSYVAVGKTERKIKSLEDLSGTKIGVLTSDNNTVSYYLASVPSIAFKNYDNVNDLFKALDNGDVAMVITSHMLNLDKTIKDDYHINYFFNNISKNIILSLDENNQSLNNIIRKVYDSWYSKKYEEDYNKTFLEYYINARNIADKTKVDLLSKTYVYGYVENPPYEFSMAGHMEGVAVEYLKRIIKLTNIDINFQKYENVSKLKEAIKGGKVDIFFNYFNSDDSKYLKSKPVFISKYVVIGKAHNLTVDNLESLRGKDVSTLTNSVITDYIKSNTKANVNEKDNISDLTSDDIVIIDSEIYNYYKNSEFSKYEVLYTDNVKDDYAFMINSTDDSFFELFNYFINTNSYYTYRNSAYNSFNGSIFDKVTFEELYLIILAVILIPIIIFILVRVFMKNRKKVRVMKKDDRKRYTDMMTSLKNRNYLNLNIDKWNSEKVNPRAIMVIDLNNTKYINDNYGREKGDMLIVKASSILINTQLENTEIIRSDGNEFLIYMIGYNENQVDIYAKKLSKSLQELPYGFGAAIGYSMIVDNIKTIDDAINEATIAMQSDKESYK